MRDGDVTHTHWSNELTVRRVSDGVAGPFINPVQLKLSHVDVWGSAYTTSVEEDEKMDVDMDDGAADKAFRWRDEVVKSVGPVGLISRGCPGHSAQPRSHGLRDRKQVSWGLRPRRFVNIHHTLAWQWQTWRQRAKWTGSSRCRWACRIRRIRGPKHQQLQSAVTNGEREGTAAAHGLFVCLLCFITCLLLNPESMCPVRG